MMVGKAWLVGNPHLTAEETTPIDERVTDEAVLAALRKLRDSLGQEKYDRCIAPIQNIACNQHSVLIRTANVRERSLLMRECLADIQAAFGVKSVRVTG